MVKGRGMRGGGAAGAKRVASPVCELRTISPKTRILLAVATGGRCQFPSCNEFLFEHPITLRGANFSEVAHVVGFSEDGPRGREGKRPADINSIGNLMLLCARCHKEIDDNPSEYPRKSLEAWKAEHERRIRYLTGLGPELRTIVVQLKALIGGQMVDIPVAHVHEALAPRWPVDKTGHVIDLTQIPVDSDNFMSTAAETITRRIDDLYKPGTELEKTRHVSLFALGPIPLLVHLGRCLSNKVPLDLFQRHRDQESPWKWPASDLQVKYAVRRIQDGADPGKVALVLSLSGPIRRETLSPVVDASFTVHEITLEGRTPGVDFLRSMEDLKAFQSIYRTFLGDIMGTHGALKEIHLFPAVPAPIAVACGNDLLPKVHPALLVYDYDKVKGGFQLRLRVNGHEA